jgi:hypothetical protein
VDQRRSLRNAWIERRTTHVDPNQEECSCAGPKRCGDCSGAASRRESSCASTAATAFGLRVGIQSEEQLAARIEASTAEMRKRGYLVASVETFTLPGIIGRRTDARWYRITFERS